MKSGSGRHDLTAQIIKTLDADKISVCGAEKRTGNAAADFARTHRVKLQRFTADRMMNILDQFGREVALDFKVGPRPHHPAGMQPRL